MVDVGYINITLRTNQTKTGKSVIQDLRIQMV